MGQKTPTLPSRLWQDFNVGVIILSGILVANSIAKGSIGKPAALSNSGSVSPSVNDGLLSDSIRQLHKIARNNHMQFVGVEMLLDRCVHLFQGYVLESLRILIEK